MENHPGGGVFSITELKNDDLPYHKPYKEATPFSKIKIDFLRTLR